MTGIEVSLDRISLIVEHPKQEAVFSRLLGLETDFHGIEFPRPDIKTLGAVARRQQQVIERWYRTIVQIWRSRPDAGQRAEFVAEDGTVVSETPLQLRDLIWSNGGGCNLGHQITQFNLRQTIDVRRRLTIKQFLREYLIDNFLVFVSITNDGTYDSCRKH